MNAAGALDTAMDALELVDDIRVLNGAIDEFLVSAQKVVEIVGETNSRAQAIIKEIEHAPKIVAALNVLRIELELRVVQLRFANGIYE